MPGPEVNRVTRYRVVICLVVLASVLVYLVAPSWNDSPDETGIANRPIQVPADGYASSRTCQSCHPNQYLTWRTSFHSTMTQVATPTTIQAPIEFEVPPEHGGPLRLTRRGDEVWAEFNDPDSAKATGTTKRIERQVVMTTGSHQQQVYWYSMEQGRLLGQLPAMYLTQERRWIPRQSAFLRPPASPATTETGRWNTTCLNCHATHAKGQIIPTAGRPPREWSAPATTAAEFGIACEACHGPGEVHLANKRSPLRRFQLRRTGQADPSVVQPARLASARASEVCGQCHSVWWSFFDSPAARDRVLAEGQPFRPGDELAASRFVVQPSRQAGSAELEQVLRQEPRLLEEHFWPDGMIRVSGREFNGLLDSACFYGAKEDSRRLSCMSCHRMHQSREDARPVTEWADTHQLSTPGENNETCLTCHPALRRGLVAHTKHSASSAGSSCYNCHMPYTSYGLLKALRSHQISSPTVSSSVQTGRPNACNLCHLDKSLGWAADQLQKSYGQSLPSLTEDQRSVAASLLWLLRGDAGQRALAAWSMGWQPALKASGNSWEAPYLALSLDDPYEAVRFIAGRSMKSLPGFEAFTSDFVSPQATRASDVAKAVLQWRRSGAAGRSDPELLLDASGSLTPGRWRHFLEQRDDRPIRLIE